MSSQKAAVRYVVFCTFAASGLLNACRQSLQIHPDSAAGGSSHPGAGGAAGTGAAGAAGISGGALDAAAGASEATDGGGAGGAPVEGGQGGTAGQSGDVAPGSVAPSYFKAGTRLKPRVLRGGGLEVVDGTTENPWFDTQTGSWCVFRKGEDGIERCYPDIGFNENTDYLDASCKKPVFVGTNLRCDGTPYQHVSIGPYGGVGCGSITYQLGAPIPAGTPLYSNAADHCASSGRSTKTVWPLETVPLDTFVAVQRVSRPALPNMDAWVREGADGSSEVVGFYDPARKAPCSSLGLDVSSDACVPERLELSYAFADSACTRPVAFDAPLGCGPSGITALLELEVESTDDGCSATTTIKRLWQAESGRGVQLFETDLRDMSCTRSSRGTDTTYLQGAPIDVASLPKLDVIQVGTGSLRLPFYGVGNVPLLPVRGAPFTEAATGDSCAPLPFADGTWRCVPSVFPRVADFDLYYQSPDCTGELVYPWGQNGCPNARREPVGMVVQLFGCGPVPVTQTFEFEGTSSSQAEVFHRTPSVACQNTGIRPGSGVKLFRATKVVNPADRFIPFDRKLSD